VLRCRFLQIGKNPVLYQILSQQPHACTSPKPVDPRVLLSLKIPGRGAFESLSDVCMSAELRSDQSFASACCCAVLMDRRITAGSSLQQPVAQPASPAH
jgi:hypothetical protein